MSEPTAERESTGDERVDAAVAGLPMLDQLDLADQLAVFSEMHVALAAVLDGEPPG